MTGFWKYTIRRLIAAVPTLLGVSLIVFFSLRLIPGDPARILAGEDANAQDIEAVRVRYGLDQPLIVQYGVFLANIVRGDFGTSLRTDAPVINELKDRFVRTMALASLATALALLISIPVGIYSAIRRGTLSERFVFVSSMIGITAPDFWFALVLQLIFAVYLGWLPTSGATNFQSMILPAITIAAYPTASIARQSRSAILEILSEDYIRTAWGKGLKPSIVYYRHALRNALIPIVTVSGYQFARALGGAIVAESVFAYPGLGRYLILSISLRDYPAVQATVLVIAVAYIFLTLLTDLAYGFLDPRISYD